MESQVTVRVGTDCPSIQELAKRAPDLLRAEEASRDFWRSLSPDRRSVVLLLAKETLERLLMDLDRWVPDSIVPGSSEWIDLRVRFQLAYLDEAGEQQTMINLQEQADAVAGLRLLLDELASD